MPGQNVPRNDPDAADQLSAFDSETPDIALMRPDVALNREEPDVQPKAQVFAMHGEPVPPVLMHDSVSVVRKRTRRNLGITLLLLGSIGVAWSGLLVMGTHGDPGAPEPPPQDPAQPTPDIPHAPPNVSATAPDPQPPARTDAPARTATPAENLPTAPATPAVDQPRREAEPPPAAAKPNAARGLFAITRPLGAQVFVDEKPVGVTPLFMPDLSPGVHQVRLERPGFKTYSSSIEVKPNERFRLAVQLEE
jgi:hypothetical protein